MSHTRCWLQTLAAVCFSLIACGSARADYELFDDFNSLEFGPISGQDGWYAQHETSVVTSDPADLSNVVLSVTTDSTRAYKELLVLKGTVRMLFLRFRFGGQQNYSFGLSDLSRPTEFDDYEAELSMSNATNDFRVNDDGSYVVLSQLEPNVWYNCWILVNHLTEELQVWLHDRPGEPATAADQLDVEGQTVFGFRYGTAADLHSFFIKTGGGSGPSGPLYLDDI